MRDVKIMIKVEDKHTHKKLLFNVAVCSQPKKMSSPCLKGKSFDRSQPTYLVGLSVDILWSLPQNPALKPFSSPTRRTVLQLMLDQSDFGKNRLFLQVMFLLAEIYLSN